MNLLENGKLPVLKIGCEKLLGKWAYARKCGDKTSKTVALCSVCKIIQKNVLPVLGAHAAAYNNEIQRLEKERLSCDICIDLKTLTEGCEGHADAINEKIAARDAVLKLAGMTENR
mgnify:FL=1